MKIVSGEWQVQPLDFQYVVHTVEIQLGFPLTFDSLDFMIEIKASMQLTIHPGHVGASFQ